MSVSGELLCSFELLKPLDSSALKSHIKKGRNKRNSILNSPVGVSLPSDHRLLNATTACKRLCTKFLTSDTILNYIYDRYWFLSFGSELLRLIRFSSGGFDRTSG